MSSATMVPMIAPNGKSGDIPANRVQEATKAGFKRAVAMTSPDGKLGYIPEDRQMDAAQAGFSPVSRPPVPKMTESKLPGLVRGVTTGLPAAGGVAGGAIAAPGVATTALGAGLGAAAGRQAELATNRAIFGPEEVSPISGPGVLSTIETGASYAIPTAAAETGLRLAADIPLESGFSAAAPRFGAPITDESLAAQRAATRDAQEEQGAAMANGYKPADEANLSQAIKEGRAAKIPARVASPKPTPTIASPSDFAPRSVGNEGRPATWTNEYVTEQAGKGNRPAITQGIRRGLELPENTRYIMGDPDFPRAVYNPRDVTRFTPEGVPIRQGTNSIIAAPDQYPGPRIAPPEEEELGKAAD